MNAAEEEGANAPALQWHPLHMTPSCHAWHTDGWCHADVLMDLVGWKLVGGLVGRLEVSWLAVGWDDEFPPDMSNPWLAH